MSYYDQHILIGKQVESHFGLKGAFSINQLNKAYRKSALLVHPDKCGGDKELFQLINDIHKYAYDTFDKLGITDENFELEIFDVNILARYYLGDFKYYLLMGVGTTVLSPLTQLGVVGFLGYKLITAFGLLKLTGMFVVGTIGISALKNT